jgi:hypothetical protein
MAHSNVTPKASGYPLAEAAAAQLSATASTTTTKRCRDIEYHGPTSTSQTMTSAAAAVDEARFLTAPHLKAASIGETDDGCLFYKRESAASKLLQFLDDATGRYGFIDGPPAGPETSSTIRYKMLCLVMEKKATVTWMHFNSWGTIAKHAKVHYGQSSLVIEKLKIFTAIQNPSFFGWVVGADYVSRCRHNNLSLLNGLDIKK